MAGGTMIDELFVLLGAKIDTRNITKWERRLDATKRKMDTMGGSMMRWGAAGAAAVGLIGNAVYDFEKKINAVNSVLTGATARQKQQIRELARELGATTQFTAGQSADAAFELAKAGFSPEEILASLPNVLSLAAAGDLTMADAANVAVANLRGFGREATELSNIMDMLAVAATKANTNIKDLGLQAAPSVAPLVAQLGGEIAPMYAMLARIQDAGIDPSKAGTQMRQIILRLVGLAGFGAEAQKMAQPGEMEGIDLAPTKSQKTLAALGIQQGELRKYIDSGDIVGAIRLLIDRGVTKDLALSAGLFDARSITVFNAIASQMYGERGILGLTGDLEKSGGAAQQMAETRMEGLPGAILTMTSALGDLQIQLGEMGITERIIQFTDKIKELIAWFKTLDEGTQSIIAHTIGLAPLLLGVGLAFKVIAFALGGIMPFLTIASAIVVGIAAVGKWIAAFVAFAKMVGIVAAVLTLPAWGLAAAIGATLGALAAGIWYFWDEITAIWRKITAYIPDWITGGGGDYMQQSAGTVIRHGPWANTTQDNRNIKIEVNPPEGVDANEVARLTVQEIQRNAYADVAENADDGTIR